MAITLNKAQFRGVLEIVSRWYERDVRAIVSKYELYKMIRGEPRYSGLSDF